MKTFLVALAFCLSLFGAQKAQANVPCAVPFNLTNGTTADASQVMANFNAGLACLATGAAASGQNSDITALLGLTNPITPLCGAIGYTAQNDAISPNTVIDIAANVAVTNTTAGLSIARSGVSLQLNFAVNGANGLDTGSFAGPNIYYLYLIDNGIAPKALASLSSTAPLLPSGYTYSCRLSAVEVTGAPVLATFYTGGNETRLFATGVYSYNTGTGTCTTAFTSITFGAPPFPVTANAVMGRISASAGHSMAVGFGTSGPLIAGLAPNGGGSQSIYFTAPLAQPGQALYVCNDSSLNTLIIYGWTDNTNTH